MRYWKDGECHQLQHQKFLQSQEKLWNVQQKTQLSKTERSSDQESI